MRRTIVVLVVGLTPSLMGTNTPNLSKLARRGAMHDRHRDGRVPWHGARSQINSFILSHPFHGKRSAGRRGAASDRVFTHVYHGII